MKPKEIGRKASQGYYAKKYWIPTDKKSAVVPDSSQTTLVFTERKEKAKELQEYLQEKVDAVQVFSEQQYKEYTPQNFGVEKSKLEDYKKMLDRIKKQGKIIGSVIFAWEFWCPKNWLNMHTCLDSWFLIVKAFHEVYRRLPQKILFLVRENGEREILPRALAGCVKSLEILYPKTRACCLFGDEEEKQLKELIYYELFCPAQEQASEVRYVEGNRQVRAFQRVFCYTEKTLLREHGTYLLTGGLGGLGKIFSRYLIENYHANLILTGRKELSQENKDYLEELKRYGTIVRYFIADISEEKQMSQVIHFVKEEGLTIHGVMHMAGKSSQEPLFSKELPEFRENMKAKIQGTVILDRVTRQEPLDFFCIFSSVSSLIGDFGQGDYAIASRFQDEYIAYRAKTDAPGKGCVINWPLWESGGMHLNQAGEELYVKSSGMDYMKEAQGLKAFEEILNSREQQLLVLGGDQERLDKLLGIQTSLNSAEPEEKMGTKTESRIVMKKEAKNLEEQLEKDVMELAAQVLQLDVAKLDMEENMGDFGFDSISLGDFADELTERYQVEISPTIFFAKSTIKDLCVYLLEEFKEQVEEFYKETGDEAVKEAAVEENSDWVPLSKKFKETKVSQEAAVKQVKEVAVIGMNFSFPQASDQEQFWKLLEQQQDAVTEIPPDRWEWKKYYCENNQEVNKTNSKWGGFIDEVDCFDAKFFKISPKEAELMDPQHRLYIQAVWKAVEDSGYKMSKLSEKKVGVFSGMQFTDYQQLLSASLDKIEAQSSIGNAPALLSNRVSFLFDFKGPSVSIDTACSSSLVALHHAVKSIQDGESEIAIAGGVSLMLDPNTYVGAGVMGVFSPDGCCKTFDESANGYVKGEGVCALVLKPLEQARLDGDSMYGVILGSAQNHGGRANSLTAPNSDAQAGLLIEAYQTSGVDPHFVTMMETHGTGTKLGDPVEVDGLKEAFKHLYEAWGHKDFDQKRIGLTALKSNIGHLEPASGISGVVKVLLSMKYKKMPGVVHFTKQNPYLKLEGSPFYILEHTTEWKRPTDDCKREHPRYAGVSSFGFGGCNAHVVLREYEAFENRGTLDLEQVFVLSAKSHEQLLCYIQEFLEDSLEGVDASDVAYTLQEGREEMEHRIAVVAKNVEEWKEKLQAYQDGKCLAGVYASDYEVLKADNSLLHEIARRWAQKEKVDFSILHGKGNHRRISLPTYPFAKIRHWIPAEQKKSKNKKETLSEVLDRNVSTIYEQAFEKYFSGDEFYIADHRHVLPGVVYLEMIREAVMQSIKKASAIKIKNVLWQKPIVVEGQGRTIRVGIRPDNKKLEASVYSLENEEEGEYAKATIEILQTEDDKKRWELTDLYESCTGGQEEAKSYYMLLEQLGTKLLDRFRGIAEFHCCQERGIGRLSVKESEEKSLNEFKMHPTLMDGGLQSAVAFAYKTKIADPSILYVPFALGELNIFSLEGHPKYAYVRKSLKAGMYFDISFLDSDGYVLMEMKELCIRPIQLDIGQRTRSSVKGNPDMLYGSLYWEESQECSASSDMDAETTILPVNEGDTPETRIQKQIKPIFAHIQSLMQERPAKKRYLFYLYHSEEAIPEYDALEGFFQTVRLESGKIIGKVIHCKDEKNWKELLAQETVREDAHRVRYVQGKRYIRKMSEVTNKLDVKSGFQKGDTILITGGLGGLGLICAQYFAKHYRADLVLISRREENVQKLDELRAFGSKVLYIRGDITKEGDVSQLKGKIFGSFGKLDVILHCAGLVNDERLINKDLEQLEQVFAPKIHGTQNLYRVFGDCEQTRFLHFSSTTSILGNVGQSDYAYANTYLDCFTLMMADRGRKQDRVINWSYWMDGHMNMDDKTEQYIRERFGMIPISKEIGMQALEEAISLDCVQLISIYGDKKQLRRQFLPQKQEEIILPKAVEKDKSMDGIEKVFEQDLAAIMGEILKMDPQEVMVCNNISDLGFDSITFTELANKINKQYQLEIMPVLFFDYISCQAIAKAILEENQMIIAQYYKKEDKGSTSVKKEHISKNTHRFLEREEEKQQGKLKQVPAREPIAVIGMSGKMPQSDSVEEFWEHLLAGDDLITPVPEERWNGSDYFGGFKQSISQENIVRGGFMKRVDTFDPLFFKISPADVLKMSPQERLMLETSWHAVEDAGYRRKDLAGSRTAVFVGACNSDYEELQILEGIPTTMTKTMIPNRISYFFDWHGPSEAVDTACSSSLVAVHRAVHAIWEEGCPYALAGGVNVIASPGLFAAGGQLGLLSKEGACKTFDSRADGYVRGEGVGAVLLKPLSKAKEDQDHIYGVIRGTAVNHVGYVNSVTTPNANAEAEVINLAYQEAGIDPKTVSYIEAHGTGTRLGDPIEIEGLKKAFPNVMQQQKLIIGAVKTNVGHLEPASGMASLFKVLMVIENQVIPGNIHLEQINPYIKIKGSKIVIPTQNQEWSLLQTEGAPRRAGISCFGVGGSNAHLILECDVREEEDFDEEKGLEEPQLILLSAKTKDSLMKYCNNLKVMLEEYALSEKKEKRTPMLSKEKLKELWIQAGNDENITFDEEFDETDTDPVCMIRFAQLVTKAYQVPMEQLLQHFVSLNSLWELLFHQEGNSNKNNSLGYGSSRLRQLAYTFACRREEMDERVAMIAISFTDLFDQLAAYIDGVDVRTKPYCGSTLDSHIGTEENEEYKNRLDDLILKKNLDEIAKLWVKGVDIPFERFYPKREIPFKVPAYCFEEERYWILDKQEYIHKRKPEEDRRDDAKDKSEKISLDEKDEIMELLQQLEEGKIKIEDLDSKMQV